MRIAFAAVLAASCLAAGAQPAADRPAAPPAGAAVVPTGPVLAELVERAWAIARRGELERARAAEIDARGIALRGVFAGAPTVSLDLRRDLPTWVAPFGVDVSPERGRNEVEPGLSAPLWLPGQRDAQRRVLERERARLGASVRLERLQLAGAVREAAWALAIADVERRVQHARQTSAATLEVDVERRVAAGELAPVDRLAARAERLAAHAAALDADARVRAAAARLRALVGADAPGADAPGAIEEPVREAPAADAHPALATARETVDAARAKLEAARATRRDNPTVSAVARFDRDVYGADYRNSIRFGIAVPLDTEARNAPRLAAAGAALAEAQLALEAALRERATEVERARIALEAARASLEAGAERDAATRAVLAALERAFRAGERGLPEVLRARQFALEAELAGALARANHGLAIARLNQALGIEP
jgi:cobalt-zinc-cadmium efflux system outer membrane protein